MKLRRGTIYALHIPFVESFRHSTKARAASDSVVVRIEDEDGVVGYGEGVPRPYVTGETVPTALAYMQEVLWPAIATRDFSELLIDNDGDNDGDDNAVRALAALAALGEALPDLPTDGVRAWNSARCAFELALLDCLLKRQSRSLATLLPPRRPHVIYSGVITAGTPEKAVEHAKRFALFGITQLKVKIGDGRDAERVGAVRAALGPKASLRVDANGVFDLPGALAALKALTPFGLDSIEQPIAAGVADELARLRRDSPVPVMVDESLVTVGDAEALIAAGACDFFNLRVSKNGGLGRTLQIAARARAAGVRLQVGAQVGETSILSAAGRHLAAYLHPTFVEGSYGTLLLTEDVARDPVAFGHGGRGALLTGPGLGVKVDDARLAKYAATQIPLGDS